jgi:hypothetical protein
LGSNVEGLEVFSEEDKEEVEADVGWWSMDEF